MIGDSITNFSHPRPLTAGDKIRFVSPTSKPNRNDIEGAAELLRSWGFEVDFGQHAFEELNYLAGTDEQRIADLNAALNDPNVRAIFATRGGKGSYRIADKIDFDAAKRDPKSLVGFSDITAIHLLMAKHGIGGGIHGAISVEDWEPPDEPRGLSLRELLTASHDALLHTSDDVETSQLTSSGRTQGILVGRNLDMVAACAGWALPNMRGRILFLEAIGVFLGQIDRQLAMLTKAGHFDGLVGFALGQFKDIRPSGSLTINDLLREYLEPYGIPILGGLPLGHENPAQRIPLCFATEIDCENKLIRVRRGSN
ncbi:MAG: LD-carboxypeptidase [Pseudomonadota bacterium]